MLALARGLAPARPPAPPTGTGASLLALLEARLAATDRPPDNPRIGAVRSAFVVRGAHLGDGAPALASLLPRHARRTDRFPGDRDDWLLAPARMGLPGADLPQMAGFPPELRAEAETALARQRKRIEAALAASGEQGRAQAGSASSP